MPQKLQTVKPCACGFGAFFDLLFQNKKHLTQQAWGILRENVALWDFGVWFHKNKHK